MPLTVAEVLEHPAYPHVIWNFQPSKKGKVAVANRRGGPFDIAFEVHGSGPNHLVWVMGLGALKWFWQRQTKDFGHDRSSKYSCLVFDNRGMGESDKPIMRYTTSEMAKDTLEVLNHLDWTSKRELHIIGISMGGMIAQEMAYLEPERIASLTLVSTAAELKSTVGYIENLRNRINILIPKSVDIQLDEVKSRVSYSWLSAPDVDGEFPTNGDRFAAQEITKRRDKDGFTRRGFLCQAVSTVTHKKSVEQLRQVTETVGGSRIQLLHGTIDNLITIPHAHVLYDRLGGEAAGVTKTIFEGRGHYLPWEERQEFRSLIESLVEKVQAL
ncbi:hypothetical protein MMC26_000028 [Xylographa opegraphella]|nr:hypothetical protein [Xylographa opegraphella]